MLDKQPAMQRHVVHLHVATGSRWVSGHVTTNHRRLIYCLNREHRDMLLIEDAVVGNRPGVRDSSEELRVAYVSTARILFAVPVEEARDSSPPPDPLLWVEKRPRPLVLGVGRYEIAGDVFLLPEADLTPSFVLTGDRFIAVGDALIKSLDDPSLVQEQAVVTVNREHISYILRT